MVAIISGPTQCQLRHIACTNYNSILLIGHIHQNLGALAGLRILVGNIVVLSILTDILEVLGNGLGDADFLDGYAQSLHQLEGVVIGAIGGAETRHRDTDDALAVESEFVERFYCYEQRQCRIESAADTHNSLLAVDVIQALNQSHHLDIQYLIAILLHVFGLGDEGIGLDVTIQLEWTWGSLFAADFAGMSTTLSIDKGGVGAALNMQGFDVNLAHLELWLQREPTTFFEQSAVLVDHRIAAINHILSRFAESAT